MKWYIFQDPSGQTWYVQADNPSAALTIAKRYSQGRGFGPTDVESITIGGEVPNFNPADPAYGGRVIFGAAGGGTGATGGTGTTGTGGTGGTGTTGGGGTGATGGGGTGATGTGEIGTYEFESTDPTGAFLRGLQQRGISQFGSLGRYNRNLESPYRSAFGALQAIMPADDPQVAGEGAFQRYVGSGASPWQDALRGVRQFSGMTPSVGSDNLLANEYISPQTAEDSAAARNLFQTALIAKLGSFAANRYGRYLPDLQDEFGAQPLETQGATNHLKYLQNRLGLGGVTW